MVNARQNTRQEDMASYISDHFQPSPNTLNLLRKKGIFEDFLESEVMPIFMTYWLELKEKKQEKGKKTCWNTAYYNWAIRSFEGNT